MYYKDVLNPYLLVISVVSQKCMDRNIIINYIEEVWNSEDQGKFTYYKEENKDDQKFNYRRFLYGVDKFFIDKPLTEYVINSKLSYAVCISFEISSPFYYYTKKEGKEVIGINTIKNLL